MRFYWRLVKVTPRSGTIRKRHSLEQTLEKLGKADRLRYAERSVGQVMQTLGVRQATHHRRRNQCGGMQASPARRFKELKQENARLKKLLVDAHPDDDILKSALDRLGNG